MGTLRLAWTLFLAALTAEAGAMCAPLANYQNAQFLRDLFEHSDAIVHAKVVEVVRDHEARINVIESFKGNPTTLRSDFYAYTSLPLRFEADTEAVFVVNSFNGQVSACGKLPVSSNLLEQLRAQKK